MLSTILIFNMQSSIYNYLTLRETVAVFLHSYSYIVRIKMPDKESVGGFYVTLQLLLLLLFGFFFFSKEFRHY